MPLIASFKGKEVHQKLIMAKACINSAGLYGLEASGTIDRDIIEVLKEIRKTTPRGK